MNSLCDALPYSVEVDGQEYRLTPAFDNVLQMYAQLDDEDLTDAERMELMLYYLTDNGPQDARVLTAACEALFPTERKPKAAAKKAFDFVQDADLIYAGFMQAYGLDLIDQQGKLHWLKFLALLQGLPSNTRFREVVEIRLRPLPAPTKYNAEERAQLLRAKQSVALAVSASEREHNLQEGLRNMALVLMQRAKKE
ncbi:MAG: Gp15 family bacteriophage protein [Phoenicibacter congonensis]|uniref:Gp15 family bacteriophage protein n=1 Tax=Phoenicibacter congonensis TaxID=1944646 RepID=A0AA43UBG7_9ACTN|nr:Gp15 family bacteriophage protein [Phoenicibacter congonensis]